MKKRLQPVFFIGISMTFLSLFSCIESVDRDRQEKAQATFLAALNRIGSTETAAHPEIYFVNDEEVIAAEQYLAEMAEYMPNTGELEEKDRQRLQTTVSYSPPAAADLEAELAALREGREIPVLPGLTREQQVARNREQMQQFEATIVGELTSLPDDRLEILRINSFLAITSIELFPYIAESLDAWDKESVDEALRLHERMRRLAIDELRRRQ